MSPAGLDNATPWFRQAESDIRTAELLLQTGTSLRPAEAGCHIAALCAQALEKSLKAYLLLNGATFAMNHRPDKYLASLLTKGSHLLHYEDHHAFLAKLFDPATKLSVSQVFDLTPGGQGKRTDTPNTEYPWTSGGSWRFTPCDHHVFADRKTIEDWVSTAKRVRDMLYKLWIAVDRGTRM